MREIAEYLDLGNLNNDRTSGDPIFRDTSDEDHERLCHLQIKNKSSLGKVKIETPGKYLHKEELRFLEFCDWFWFLEKRK